MYGIINAIEEKVLKTIRYIILIIAINTVVIFRFFICIISMKQMRSSLKE